MIRTNTNNITSNKKNHFSSVSSEPPWTSSSFTTMDDSTLNSDIQNLSTWNYNSTEDDNIDWDYVSKQLEIVR